MIIIPCFWVSSTGTMFFWTCDSIVFFDVSINSLNTMVCENCYHFILWYQSPMDLPSLYYSTATVLFSFFLSKGLNMFRECFALLIHLSSTRPQERWRDIAQCWQTARQISKIIISRFQQPPCLFPAPYPHLSLLLYPLSVFIDIDLMYTNIGAVYAEMC